MKQIAFISLLILSLNSYSEEIDPSLFCDQTYQCTDKMREISTQYKTGNSEFAKESLIGLSGACYHISSLYDSDHEHHGAFLFERSSQGLMTTGVFSFFAEQDPYEGMNSVELKEWFIQNNSRFEKAIESSSQVELQFLDVGSDFHYWFRGHKDNNKVFVIGKQLVDDYAGFIFCELNHR